MSDNLSFSPQCDWLTIATFKFSPYTAASAFVEKNIGKHWKPAKWLQYEGRGDKYGAFHGHATQTNDREHYVIKIPGHHAPEALDLILGLPWAENFYATRIDLQRTKTTPDWWNPRGLYDSLTMQGKTSSVIQSKTGSTLYIGNRRSGRFTRIYEKNEGGKFLRLEIELKGAWSRRTWEMLLDGTSVNELYAAHLNRLPLPQRVIDDYTPAPNVDLDLEAYRRESNDENRLDWLLSLVPTFEKMTNSHTIGHRTITIFKALSAQRDEHDDHFITSE